MEEIIQHYLNPFGLMAVAVLLLPNFVLLLRRKRQRHYNGSKILSVLRLLSGIGCVVLMSVNLTGEQVSFENQKDFVLFLDWALYAGIAYLIIWIWYFVQQNIISNALMEISAVAFMFMFVYCFGAWQLLIPIVLFAVTNTIIIVKTHFAYVQMQAQKALEAEADGKNQEPQRKIWLKKGHNK